MTGGEKEKSENKIKFLEGQDGKWTLTRNFREDILVYINKIIDRIKCLPEQKNSITNKSIDLLNDFVSRAKNGEFPIRSNANAKVLAATIIYTILISSENMPNVGSTELCSILGISDVLSRTYNRYFKHLFPKKESDIFTPSGFVQIRNLLSIYFFNMLRNSQNNNQDLLSSVKNNIINKTIFASLLSNDIDTLSNIYIEHGENFIKYISDLIQVVCQLVISSLLYKNLGAYLNIKLIARFLFERGINFFKDLRGFYRILLKIYEFLKNNVPDFFPEIMYSHILSTNNYKSLVRSKLKLYVMAHIYKGKYYINKKVSCPECLSENLSINTDWTREKALEFDHPKGKKKDREYSSQEFFKFFTRNQSDPNVLELIIKKMESERVRLLCRNHHLLSHCKNYLAFQYFLNWKDLLSYSGEELFILARVCVNNCSLTKNLSKQAQTRIASRLIGYLKKKFIIEQVFGRCCQICGEFSTSYYLPIFVFAHLYKNKKTFNASSLFDKYSCSEIVESLVTEKGGYICSNCHTVLDYNNIDLFQYIYDSKTDLQKVLLDYKNVKEKFSIIKNKEIIDPLGKNINITSYITEILLAINHLSVSGENITSKNLGEYLGVDPTSINSFFQEKALRKTDFILQYIDISFSFPTRYSLTAKGKEFVKTILHFRDYYSSI